MGFADTLKRRKWLVIGGTTLVVLLVLFIYFRYAFVYSEGTRVGIIYKFSKKGTIFKTYEGTMMLPGIRNKSKSISTNTFNFSVTDEELAKTLMKSQGMEVELHYSYYNGALPWRGDSYDEEDGQYIVDKLVRIKDKNPNGYGL
ncbi:MAG: hypothetical protein P8P74_18085 [Crocinitomicaceae bacterium]|nr:hypothetical protein [Crocinitomicaceae bacterium]